MAQRQNTGRINDEQKVILVEFLENHKDLVSGNLTRTFTHAEKMRLWQELANILNAVGAGATKNEESWRGCWGDIKSNLKKKLGKFKKSIEQTGGGFANANPITEFEERVAALMGDSTLFGIQGAKESGTEAFNMIDDSLPPVSPCIQIVACRSLLAPENITAEATLGTQACEEAFEGMSDSQITSPHPTSACPNTPGTSFETPRNTGVRTQRASNTFLRRRNIKRQANRSKELEEAATTVGSFASAQDRQSKAMEAIAATLKKTSELEEEKLQLKKRKVEAEERKAAALEGLLQFFITKV